MEYADLVKEIVDDVLESVNAPIRVGQNVYHLSSLKDEKEREHIAKTLAKQNEHIDNLSKEEKANRDAQFNKSIEGTAKKAS